MVRPFAVALCAAVPCWSLAAQTVPDSSARRITDVTVSAERVDRPASRLPMSVTALAGTQLERRAVRDLTDLLGTLPGVSQETARGGFNRLVIRGVNAGGQFGWRQGAATAIYLDDAPLATRTNFWFGAPDLDLFDLTRVEVLRGPQGTLFGASAIGGAIRLVANAPDLRERHVRTEVESGFTAGAGTPDAGLRTVVNVPLVRDRLAVRVVGDVRRSAGFIDALITDRQRLAPVATARTLSDFNDNTRLNLRLSLLGRPAEGWEIQPTLHLLQQRGGGIGAVRFNAVSQDGDRTVFGRNAAFDADGRPYESLNDLLALGTVRITRTLGIGRVVATTSFDRRRARQRDDAVAANGNWIESFAIDSAYDATLEPSYNDFGTRTRRVTQELRFDAKGTGRLRGTVGFFFSDLRQTDTLHYSLEGGTPGLLARYELSDPVTFAGRDRFDEQEVALFADGTLALLPSLDLTLGVRGTRYTQSLDRFQASPAFGDVAGNSLVLPADATRLTPRVAVAWRPQARTMVYASASEGFRTGGANPPEIPIAGRCPNRASLPARPAQFAPDRTWNYEVGAKGRSAGGRLLGSVAAYQLDWSDIQTAVTYTCSDNTTINWTGNAARARTRGVELEGAAQLLPSMQVTVAGAYTDAVFNRDAPEASVTAGTPLGYVPRWSGGVTSEWVATRSWRGVVPSVAVSWRHMGGRVDPVYGDVTNRTADTNLPAYDVVGLRLGAGRDRWEVALVAQNLFDTRAALEQFPTFAVNGFQAQGVRVGRLREETTLRPRSVGLLLRVRS